MNDVPTRPAFAARRRLALAGIAVSVAVLIPGLVLPVISVTGTLDPDGVATLAPQLLEQGLNDEALAQIRPMLNPALLMVLDAMPGGLRDALATQLGRQVARGIAEGPPVVVYEQTRSILGSVRHLYLVGSEIAAGLILLFSVIVPFTKAVLVLWAVLRHDRPRSTATLGFVEIIAKWSMADVFAMALIIAYLAAQASQTPPGPGFVAQPVIFTATFGAGFYWFTGYCLLSLFTQQVTARRLMRKPG